MHIRLTMCIHYHMKLVIVESPSKAKTIEKYLGKEYTVRASVGHVRDLPKSNKKAIDIEAGFVPHYEISKGKEKVVDELKKLAKKADEVILATDPDREGEAIAWHVADALKLKDKQIHRVVFHEITENAVKEAIKHPRKIDEQLLHAQEARRVLDRLVGYDLSGLIWKKVRYGLSAGRVQSPALRIIMEREREIRAFIPEAYFVITADLKPSKGGAMTFTCSEEPKEEKEADRIVKIGTDHDWQVTAVEEREQARKSRAPFTTSTMQQTASSRLGFSPANSMRIAQKLYEAGHITYMRTDSTTLSKDALAAIKQIITEKYGANMHEEKKYKAKSKNAQEAHEAIRPTNALKDKAGTTDDQKKLYKLIWERTVASQMVDAKLKKTKIKANVTGAKEEIPDFAINGSRVIEPGWLTCDSGARGEDTEVPLLSEGDKLSSEKVESERKETEPPHRYTEAGLVKELEKRDIGRPSTYASIIRTIVDRGYVNKEGKTLFPTDTGDVVSSFLEQYFAQYIGDTFTAGMEEQLDDIAKGERKYEKTLSDFYKPFQKEVKDKDKEIGKITTLGDAPNDEKCPTCKGKMVVKLGKSGKFLSCEKYPDCEGARTMEGEEMKGPEETGEDCPKCKEEGREGRLVERHGRFGKFISCGLYPKCKFIKEDEETKRANSTGVNCPICKKAGRDGVMVEKRGRFGPFFGCSEYPDCKHIIKTRPTGDICGYIRDSYSAMSEEHIKGACPHLMMEGTKTIPTRCSDKACPNHNPHKLEPKTESK